MNVLVSGATGLVGSALLPALTERGHVARRLSRGGGDEHDLSWRPERGEIDEARLGGFDAVVHLAGESIAKGRWTEDKKARIRDSRRVGTRLLCDALARSKPLPKVLVSASAVGFYGNRGDAWLDEESALGAGFLAEVCREWEAATRPAIEAGIRVVHARFGFILSRHGGGLAQMLPPFRAGVGGKIGSGEQYVSWIAIEDLVGAILHALASESLRGPVNFVGPAPVTNRDFVKSLGRVLKRPTFVPMPTFAARIAFGEMADELLLSSQRVAPRRLLASGYQFQCPDLDGTFSHVLEKAS